MAIEPSAKHRVSAALSSLRKRELPAMAAADTHTVTADTLLDLLGQLERPDDVPEADWEAGLAMARAAVEDASASA